MTYYVAIIHKEDASDYGVSFPDFPGCLTAGSSLVEAEAMAKEALSLHIRGMQEDGETIPDPIDLDQAVLNANDKDTIHAYLLIEAVEIKPRVRINIMLDADLLNSIDSQAKSLGMTRSGYLSELARKEL